MPITNFIWLMAVIAFIVLEAVTYQMVAVWFVAGAIGGMMASLVGTSFTVQIIVFLAVSVLFLALLRPVAMKRMNNQKLRTNSDGLVGKSVLITADVSNTLERGEGKLDGKVWSVRTESGEELKAGEVAEVKRIEGVKLIVG